MSVLVPNDKPPRLIRFVNSLGDAVATYDSEQNLLCIDRELFRQLSPVEQEKVIRTTDEWVGMGLKDVAA